MSNNDLFEGRTESTEGENGKIENLKLAAITIENFLGLAFYEAEIEPDTHIIVVSGKNEAGKSRFISSVPFTLGVEKIDSPTTVGRKTGKTTLHFNGDKHLEIEKKFSTKSSSTVTVKLEGEPIKSPQRFLNLLTSPEVIKPLEFHEHFDDAKRLAFLYSVMGNKEQIEKLEAEYDGLYDKRRDTNKESKTLQGKLDGAPVDDGTKEVSIASLLSELKSERERVESLKELQKSVSDAEEQIDNYKARIAENNTAIEELKKQIADLEAENNRFTDTIAATEEDLPALHKQIEEFPPSQEDALQEKVDSAEQINQKARAITAANEQREELKELQKKSDSYTRQLDDIKFKKQEILNNAHVPIEDLTIEDGAILINGLPWNQQSTAQGVLNAMKLANMSNAKIRNIVVNWDHLDSESRKAVSYFAKEHNYLIFAEQVADEKTPESTIHLENGEFK